jgi:secreted protein with Ig-like and vWFA domain
MVKRLLLSFEVITAIANSEIQQTHYLGIVCCWQSDRSSIMAVARRKKQAQQEAVKGCFDSLPQWKPESEIL